MNDPSLIIAITSGYGGTLEVRKSRHGEFPPFEVFIHVAGETRGSAMASRELDQDELDQLIDALVPYRTKEQRGDGGR